jgi:hypothetical protein
MARATDRRRRVELTSEAGLEVHELPEGSGWWFRGFACMNSGADAREFPGHDAAPTRVARSVIRNAMTGVQPRTSRR